MVKQEKQSPIYSRLNYLEANILITDYYKGYQIKKQSNQSPFSSKANFPLPTELLEQNQKKAG